MPKKRGWGTGDPSVRWHLFADPQVNRLLLYNSRVNNVIIAVVIGWQVVSVGKESEIRLPSRTRGERAIFFLPFDFHRANYQRRLRCAAAAHKWGHTAIPHACVYFVCYRQAHNTPPSPPPQKKASYTGALFKRQRIDGNLWQWRAGHSWVSISPLSLWTPGSTAAQHNAPLSPPAFTPVPRGEMDKRERGGKKWEEVVVVVEEDKEEEGWRGAIFK